MATNVLDGLRVSRKFFLKKKLLMRGKDREVLLCFDFILTNLSLIIIIIIIIFLGRFLS